MCWYSNVLYYLGVGLGVAPLVPLKSTHDFHFHYQGTSSRLWKQSFFSRKSMQKNSKQVNVRATMLRAASGIGRWLLTACRIATCCSHIALTYLFAFFLTVFRETSDCSQSDLQSYRKRLCKLTWPAWGHMRNIFNAKNSSSYHRSIYLVLTIQSSGPFNLIVSFCITLQSNLDVVQFWAEPTKLSKICLTIWIMFNNQPHPNK